MNCSTPPGVLSNYSIFYYYFILASELDGPPDGYDGEVDVEEFWDSICLERIARGFVPSK